MRYTEWLRGWRRRRSRRPASARQTAEGLQQIFDVEQLEHGSALAAGHNQAIDAIEIAALLEPRYACAPGAFDALR